MYKKLFFIFLLSAVSCCLFSQTQGLDYYIQQGLQNSPLLKDYQNQIQASSIDSTILNAQRRPQVNAISLVQVVPTYQDYGYDAAITNGGNYGAQVSVVQNVFNKKAYKPQYEAIRIQKQSLTNTSKLSEHDLKKGITDQYLVAYNSLKQLDYTRATLKLLNDERDILKRLTEEGVYKQTDYLSFEIAMQSQEIQIKQAQNQYKNDVRQLNVMCGINDTASMVLAAPELKMAGSGDKYNSPFFKQFKLDSISIINRKDAVSIKYRPQFNWFADAGLLASNPDPSLLYKNFGTSFGFNFSMPLYDGKQKKLQYQKLSISESTRLNYQSYFKNQYNQHVQQITMQLAENEQLISQIQKQMTTSETLINQSKQLLNAGTLSVTDFIITIKNYIDIKNQMNQAQLVKLQLMSEYNYWNW
jgi:outer membrane protein TolC